MRCFHWALAPMLFVLLSASAYAGIEIGGTRLIFNGNKKEATISVKNPENETPYLIQSWLDNENNTDASKVPFIITPPLFRLDPRQENLLRVVATGLLPQDRESLYWLNVKSIAATKRDTNRLQISVRTRIKMIYRPASITNSAPDAYKHLLATRNASNIVFKNPTPHYVSFFSVRVGSTELNQPLMVPPFGSYSIKAPSHASGKIIWRAINDYGGRTEEVSN